MLFAAKHLLYLNRLSQQHSSLERLSYNKGVKKKKILEVYGLINPIEHELSRFTVCALMAESPVFGIHTKVKEKLMVSS
jgi:hypothetical protein